MIFCDLKLPSGGGELFVEDGVFTDRPSGERVSLGGKRVLPGMVDTHIHGAFGEAFDHADADIHAAARGLARHGVTAFCPTLSALSEEDALSAIRNIVEAARSQGEDEARVVGIHLEGPFVSPHRKGALNPDNLRTPDLALFDRLIDAGEGLVKLMTVAPELNGAIALAEHAESRGVRLSMGHSVATYEQAKAAVDGGFRRATHIFNGMEPFSHRAPGVLGAALTDDRVVCEMICDLVHLDAPAMEIVLRCKGFDRVIAISDAISGAGLADGDYELGGMSYHIADGVAKFPNGTICGSAATLDRGLRNLLAMGVSHADAARLTSKNAAEFIGADAGTLDLGARADFITVDEHGGLCGVWLAGRRII